MDNAYHPDTHQIFDSKLERAGKPRRPRMSKIMSKINIKFLCLNEMEGFFAPCRPGRRLARRT